MYVMYVIHKFRTVRVDLNRIPETDHNKAPVFSASNSPISTWFKLLYVIEKYPKIMNT